MSGIKCTDQPLEKIAAVEVPLICSPLTRPKMPRNLLAKFEGLEHADRFDREGELCIDILIGLDYYWQLQKPCRVHLSEGPVAVESSFGWVVYGTWTGITNASLSCQLLNLQDLPDESLRQFWELESIGINHSYPVKDQDIDPVLEGFNKSVKFDNQSIGDMGLHYLGRLVQRFLSY